jgi:hypothetical protein
VGWAVVLHPTTDSTIATTNPLMWFKTRSAAASYDASARRLQSAASSRVGVAVSSLSFRIVFALRMVIFLYRGVPTILFM